MESPRPTVRRVTAAAITVFAVAVALRMPSCYESFWLDELHSAWSVWGTLAEAAPRADAGHQSPLYFFGLWFWKQIVGESELALRMSSVIATSLGCVVLTIGVTRWTKSLSAGITSGMVLAIESNAIFFGTELRPYSFIILVSAIAQSCFLSLVDVKSRFECPRLWSVLIVSILLAALIQPTAIGVMSIFPLVLMGWWTMIDRRELTRFGMLDAFLLISAVTTGLALWRTTLGESWQARSQWAAFGSAFDVRQIAESWDWLWLMLVPLGVVAITQFFFKRSSIGTCNRRLCLMVIVVSLMASAGTCLYWLISWLDWAPIWHRRYFVAVLPIFATACGGAVGTFHQAVGSHPQGPKLAAVLGGLLLVGLGVKQKTLQALVHYPVALAVRGENWRAAIRWVNEQADEGDRVYLDPGLIESRSLFGLDDRLGMGSGSKNQVTAFTPWMEEYFLFPVSGPYQVDRPVEFCNAQLNIALASDTGLMTILPSSTDRQWIILRGRIARGRQDRARESHLPFGGVSVIIRSEVPEE